MPSDVESLKRARESFVRKRREMAEQMIPAGAALAHFAPNFVGIQTAIEAIDRAIADEESLPDGYAAAEARPVELAAVDGRTIDRDYDPA